MSMGVINVNDKAYVVTTCGSVGGGTVYVHSGSGATWTSANTTDFDSSIVGDSTPFWCKSDTDAITLRGGYSN